MNLGNRKLLFIVAKLLNTSLENASKTAQVLASIPTKK